MKILLSALLAASALSIPLRLLQEPAPAPGAAERAAVAKVLPLLQSSARTWIQKRSCVSCHHQALGLVAVEIARTRGFTIDAAMEAEQVARMRKVMVGNSAEVLQGIADINGQIGQSYKLWALEAAGVPQDGETDVRVHFLLGKQQGDGRWRSESHRPPLEDNDFTATALSVRALRAYCPPGRGTEILQRLERAHSWLAQATPRSTEERAMKLLGLFWGSATSVEGITAELHAAHAALLREQRSDGGWAQIATRASDAYATGQVLVALEQSSGLSPTDPAFRRGIEFLLRTQLSDGTWKVTTRRKSEGLPYFETGFPHGEDQFISYAGTAWAVLALCSSIDGRSTAAFSPPHQIGERRADGPDTTGLTALQRDVLFGDLDTVRRRIDIAGADVNERGPGGVTALMCAAGDVAKARLLLERGAAVDARSEAQYTALIVAAGQNGGREVAALLLEHGADVRARAESSFTPLSRAVLASDRVLVERLLAAGASLEPARSTDYAPLACATMQGDAELAARLLALGAKYGGYPDDPPFGYLSGAVIDGQTELVRVLLAGGAALEEKDADGFTPLLWAASVDFGDTAVLEALLAKGADVAARSKAGETALALAEKHGNARHAEILRKAGAGK